MCGSRLCPEDILTADRAFRRQTFGTVSSLIWTESSLTETENTLIKTDNTLHALKRDAPFETAQFQTIFSRWKKHN